MIAEYTGQAAHFSWQFRADPQVEKNYGSRSWAFHYYAREIETLIRAGDDIGLHLHAYRWQERQQTWTDDYGDQAWVEDVTSAGFEAYQGIFGHPPASFSTGVSWTNSATIRLVERLGARYEISAVPGRNKAFPDHAGDFCGSLPDTSNMPLQPYQPCPGDFMQPAVLREDGLWVIPPTAGRQSRGGLLKRRIWGLSGTLEHHTFVNALYLTSPLEYLVPQLNAPCATHFSLLMRSEGFGTLKNRMVIRRNLHYLLSPERPCRFTFVRPDELVRQCLLNDAA
jgi:hypothetical protein